MDLRDFEPFYSKFHENVEEFMDLRDFELFYSEFHENVEALDGANVGFYGMGGVGTIILILKVAWQFLEEKLYVNMIGVYGMGGVGNTTLLKKLFVWGFQEELCVTWPQITQRNFKYMPS